MVGTSVHYFVLLKRRLFPPQPNNCTIRDFNPPATPSFLAISPARHRHHSRFHIHLVNYRTSFQFAERMAFAPQPNDCTIRPHDHTRSNLLDRSPMKSEDALCGTPPLCVSTSTENCAHLTSNSGRKSMKTTVIPHPQKRHGQLVYDRHPILGDYTYSSPGRWMQNRLLPNGSQFSLCGIGRMPSNEQVELWMTIETELSRLTRVAKTSCKKLLIGDYVDAFCEERLAIQLVRLETATKFSFVLRDPDLENTIEIAPMVTFSGSSVYSTEWVI